MAAKLLGCLIIVVVDRIASRLELARSLGATHAVNTGTQDALEVINNLGGMDFSVEATGNSKLLEIAVAGLKPFGGVCALLGVPKAGSTISLDHGHLLTGRSIIGVTQGEANPQEFIPYLAQLFMEGKLPVDKLVRVYNLDQINEAAADSAAGRTVKPVLRMS
jgi:aryl-alcohol dehydrogenase